jgi:hypothetical protein
MTNRANEPEKALLYFATALTLILIVAMFVSFPVGAYSFYSNQLNGTPTTATLSYLPLFAIGMLVRIPLPPGLLSLGYLFFAIWAVFIALFVMLLKGPWYNILKALKSLPSDRSLAVYSNGALTLGLAFPALLVLTVVLEALLDTVGLPVGNLPDIGAREAFFSISYAPLIEEVGFRVTIIGLVAAAIAFRSQGGWTSLKALWHPSRALGEVKVEAWKQGNVYAAILISALVFGAQHVLQGAGWEIGKAVSSFVVGLALGIIYFTHGFPAAVMMHWSFNYFEGSFYYFDLARGLPPLDATSEFSSLAALQYSQFYVDALVILTSVAVFAFLAYLMGKSFLDRKDRPKGRPA